MKKIIAVVLLMVVLTGCADTVTFDAAKAINSVGFWYGLWHGWIAPFSWLISLFDSDVAIYAIYNNGGWYDFGYVLGLGMLSGGIGLSRD